MNTKAKTTIQWHYRQAINLRLGTIGNEGLEVLIWTEVNGTRFMALINHLYTVHPWFYVVDTYNIIAKTNHYTNIKFPLTKKNVFLLNKTLFGIIPIALTIVFISCQFQTVHCVKTAFYMNLDPSNSVNQWYSWEEFGGPRRLYFIFM